MATVSAFLSDVSLHPGYYSVGWWWLLHDLAKNIETAPPVVKCHVFGSIPTNFNPFPFRIKAMLFNHIIWRCMRLLVILVDYRE